MVALLGTDSDAAVAGALGIHPGSVTGKRHRLGIPPFNPPPHDQYRRFPWRPEHLALLGKVSDGELARALGLATATVTRKRQALRIPPFQPAYRPIEWTPEMIQRLGEASDARVAEELGISAVSVKRKRQALGIPPTRDNLPVERNDEVAALLRLPDTEVQHRTGLDRRTIQKLRDELGVQEIHQSPRETSPGPRGRPDGSTASERGPGHERPAPRATAWRTKYRWRPEEIALLGTASDQELAARLGRTVLAVLTRRQKVGILQRAAVRPWRPHEIELLGTAPDVEIAARLERSVSAVRRRRRELGILYQPVRRWRPHEIELLGKAPDVDVAARLGRSTKSIELKRRRLGIPAFPRTARRRWTPAEEALLGTAPDADVARRIGRSVEAVRTRRRFLQRERGSASSRVTP
jgi:hypothetical protein